MAPKHRRAAPLLALAGAVALGGCALSLGSPFGAGGPVGFRLSATSGCATALLGTAPEAARMGIRSSANYAMTDVVRAYQSKAVTFNASAVQLQNAQRLARGGCIY